VKRLQDLKLESAGVAALKLEGIAT